MKLIKMEHVNRYILQVVNTEVSVCFNYFTVEAGTLVSLWTEFDDRTDMFVAHIHGVQVPEFHKAWRQMKCREV